MTVADWTEQDARDWLSGEIANINHAAVLRLLLADLDALRSVRAERPAGEQGQP
jgi:hypothetical protein